MKEYDTTGWGKPFELKNLDSKADMCTLRMNENDRKMLNELKDIFHCDRDSTVVKQCLALVYGNVVQSQPTIKFFQWLSSSRRVRPGPKMK